MKILKNLGSLAFVLLIAGSLQAGGHASSLKWYSDGGVDLITFEDKEVIHLSKEQLGSYFGKGKQPYKGKKIAITVNNSGPKGGISGPLHRLRPAWEELTGANRRNASGRTAEQDDVRFETGKQSIRRVHRRSLVHGRICNPGLHHSS